MKAGPVRRLVAAIGLLGLVPIGYLLITGSLSLEEAGMRAGVTLGAVIVISRLAGWGFTMLAGSIEAGTGWDGGERRAQPAGPSAAEIPPPSAEPAA